MKKPKWVVEKERLRKSEKEESFFLFGLHAVEDALFNPRRKKLRLILTKNAQAKLAKAIEVSGITPEVLEPRDLNNFIDKNSIHQGALLEVRPLEWGSLMDVVMQSKSKLPNLVLLDRVTDPHNVGAILRSAEVFGASAVVGTRHHSAGNWSFGQSCKRRSGTSTLHQSKEPFGFDIGIKENRLCGSWFRRHRFK